MKDAEYVPEEEHSYECYECGKLITAEANPGDCPNCGAEMRNRHYPIE